MGREATCELARSVWSIQTSSPACMSNSLPHIEVTLWRLWPVALGPNGLCCWKVAALACSWPGYGNPGTAEVRRAPRPLSWSPFSGWWASVGDAAFPSRSRSPSACRRYDDGYCETRDRHGYSIIVFQKHHSASWGSGLLRLPVLLFVYFLFQWQGLIGARLETSMYGSSRIPETKDPFLERKDKTARRSFEK